MKYFGLIVVLLLSSVAYSAPIQLDSDSRLIPFLKDTIKLLPQSFFDTSKEVTYITEKIFKTDSKIISSNFCNLNDTVTFGITKKNKIYISSKLITLADSDFKVYECGHKTFRRLLIAVLIHELTHVKDRIEKISSDPEFQRIIGVKKVTKNTRQEIFNNNFETSPDPNEFKNIEESLAVNSEFFFMDPDFECRRPATAKYLSRKYNHPLSGGCKRIYDLLIQSSFIEDHYLSSVSIRPDRVYQVHYLFAGKGDGIMSRWGHAMFRLIICAPHREEIGPDCLNDVSHHIALSYRASMIDSKVNYLKGIWGGYPSQLFVFKYLEVLQEYTKYDLRDLYSIPLRLSEAQKEEFLDITLERFWSYKSKYYFFNNNCGTEALKHLAATMEEDEVSLISSMTPLRIFRDIRDNQDRLSELKFDLDRQELIDQKILIESYANEINRTFEFLKKIFKAYEFRSLKEFLIKSKPSDRYAEYQNSFIEFNNQKDDKFKLILYKILFIERYLEARFHKEISTKAISLIQKNIEIKTEVLRMSDNLKSLAQNPWEIIKATYGVPLLNEFEEQYKKFKQKREMGVQLSVREQVETFNNILGNNLFRNELVDIEQIKKIKKLINNLILTQA